MQGIGFIDIETVRATQSFLELETVYQEAFRRRFLHLFKETEVEFVDLIWQEIFEKEAAFTAEYGKIVSVSIGNLYQSKDYPQPMFFIKTFTGRDEKTILQAFNTSLMTVQPIKLCGHNILEFDAPILMRRCLALGLPIPSILDSMVKKPYELPYLDTMAMYSGSQWKYKISQKMLAYILVVPSSKDDMDGSDIAELYYNQEHGQTGLDKIGGYNAKDVLCNARIFAKMRGFKDIKDEDVVYLKG